MSYFEESDFIANSTELPSNEEQISKLKDAKVKTAVQKPLPFIVYAPPVLGSLFYTFGHRSILYILLYSFFICIPMLSVSLFTGDGIFQPFKKKDKTFIAHLVLFVFLLFFMSILFYSLAVSLKDLFLYIISPALWKHNFVFLTIIIILFGGGFLFFFRLKLRGIYGITEVLVGFTVSVNKIETNSNFDYTFYLAMLTAGVYLVVRGLDNLHQGLTKEPLDPIILFIRFKLKERFNEKFEDLIQKDK